VQAFETEKYEMKTNQGDVGKSDTNQPIPAKDGNESVPMEPSLSTWHYGPIKQQISYVSKKRRYKALTTDQVLKVRKRKGTEF